MSGSSADALRVTVPDGRPVGSNVRSTRAWLRCATVPVRSSVLPPPKLWAMTSWFAPLVSDVGSARDPRLTLISTLSWVVEVAAVSVSKKPVAVPLGNASGPALLAIESGPVGNARVGGGFVTIPLMVVVASTGGEKGPLPVGPMSVANMLMVAVGVVPLGGK